MEYPDCITRALSELAVKRDKTIELVPHAAAAEKIAAEYPEIVDGVSIGIGVGSVQGVLLHARDLKTPRDVAPVLRALAAAGYKQTAAPDDYAELGRRMWICGTIKLLGFFGDEPDACKFVKIGEETVDVVKLVCPDSVEETEGAPDEPA